MEPIRTVVWDGVTRPQTLRDDADTLRQRLADRAKAYDWPAVMAILRKEPALVNVTRPGGKSWYAPLHQAAHGGAPESVVRGLLELGAWRTLKNAAGEIPLDVARRQGHQHLLALLEPVYRRAVPIGALLGIQQRFHAVIRDRVGDLVERHGLRLPELEPLLETDEVEGWFGVPGMHGGFNYRLEAEGDSASLLVESWSRVVGGSGQRHRITAAHVELIEEGFV